MSTLTEQISGGDEGRDVTVTVDMGSRTGSTETRDVKITVGENWTTGKTESV